MKPAVIVDIDGTVADMGKGQLDRRSPFDWHRVGEDTPIRRIIRLVGILRSAGFQILYVSGRSDACRNQTEMWLATHGAIVDGDMLFMRKDGDYRPDEEVKAGIYKCRIEPDWNVQYVLDDRNKVVAMWRELGLTVLQVADGDF